MFDDIKFDDGERIRKWLEATDDFVEQKDYERIVEQFKADPDIEWGGGLNALVISDRCPGRANGLTEYLFDKTDLSNVMLLKTLNDAQAYVTEVIPDILIFVGYQEDAQNYKVQDIVLKLNPRALIVMYALLDGHIRQHCIDNDIQYAFSSTKPVADFIAYIQKSLSTHAERIKKEPVDEPVLTKERQSRIISISGWLKNRKKKG